MRVLGLTTVGDASKAKKAMLEVAKELDCSPQDAAQKIMMPW